jgi:hypothetical protein
MVLRFSLLCHTIDAGIQGTNTNNKPPLLSVACNHIPNIPSSKLSILLILMIKQAFMLQRMTDKAEAAEGFLAVLVLTRSKVKHLWMTIEYFF